MDPRQMNKDPRLAWFEKEWTNRIIFKEKNPREICKKMTANMAVPRRDGAHLKQWICWSDISLESWPGREVTWNNPWYDSSPQWYLLQGWLIAYGIYLYYILCLLCIPVQ
jgi:hypothetical protein